MRDILTLSFSYVTHEQEIPQLESYVGILLMKAAKYFLIMSYAKLIISGRYHVARALTLKELYVVQHSSIV